MNLGLILVGRATGSGDAEVKQALTLNPQLKDPVAS